MKCVKAGGMHPWSCGQCMPCRIDKKREWTSRLMLESRSHSVSSFITLTYNDEHLRRELTPRDVQNWLKRLRKEFGSVRYYLVGEYGESTWRPHYHVALYGFPNCVRGRTDRRRLSTTGSCCPSCDLVHRTWGYGMIDVASLTHESAGYICGYTTKKMTKPDDPRLRGLHPEFARMSLRPGIGALALGKVADDVLTSPHLMDQLWSGGTVPANLKSQGQSQPIGRYLRGKLYEEIGFGPKTSQKIRNDLRHADLSSMHEGAKNYEEFTALKNADPRFVVYSQEEKLQKARNLETRVKLFKSKRTI